MTKLPVHHHRLLGVEDRRVRVLDDVGGHDRILGVREDPGERALGRLADGRVDLLRARLRAELAGEVDDRAGDHRRADRHPVELAVQLRQHQADRLGRAGRGRDQVDRGRPRSARVLVRAVLEALILRVGVDRGHQAALDPELVVEHLGDRREAVRRAGRVGDDVVVLGVVGLVEVDAQGDRHVRVGRRRRDDHLLRPGVEMLGGVVALGEQAGRLDHDVDAELAPRQIGGVTLGEHLDLGPVDGEGVVADLDRRRRSARRSSRT